VTGHEQRQQAWHRIAPGLYERADGQRRITKMVLKGEGPKGGTWIEWAEMRPDTHPAYEGQWICDGTIERTLREAKARIG